MMVCFSAFSLFTCTVSVGVDIKTFVDASLLLIQPLEDFFNNVFVMAVSLRCPSITFVSAAAAAAAAADPCWVSY